MENKKPMVDGNKMFMTVLFIVVTAVLFLGIGFVFGQQAGEIQQNEALSGVSATAQATLSATVSSTSTAASELAGWKTYTNDKYGFSFKYPSDWAVSEKNFHDARNLSVVGDKKSDLEKTEKTNEGGADIPYSFEVDVYKSMTQFDSKDLGVKTLAEYVSKYSTGSDPYLLDPIQYTIGNTSGYKAKAGTNVFGGGDFYLASNGNSYFEIVARPTTSELDKQILSTFQFTPVK